MASDFLNVFQEWTVDGVQWVPASGVSFEGVTSGTPETFGPVMLEDTERMVRTSDGREVLSTLNVYVPGDDPVHPVPGGTVVLPSGRRATVLSVRDLAPFGVLDHRVVSCE